MPWLLLLALGYMLWKVESPHVLHALDKEWQALVKKAERDAINHAGEAAAEAAHGVVKRGQATFEAWKRTLGDRKPTAKEVEVFASKLSNTKDIVKSLQGKLGL